MPEDQEKNQARVYLKQELNRLQSQEADALEKVKRAEQALKKLREQIVDFKQMLGIAG